MPGTASADNYTNAIGTGSTYLVKEADEGFKIEVKATATNDNGVAVTRDQRADGGGHRCSADRDGADDQRHGAGRPDADRRRRLRDRADNPLTYSLVHVGRQLHHCDRHRLDLQVKEGDEGFKIEVKATATNDNGVAVTADQHATAAVIDAAPTVTVPTIGGTAQEGQTLTASATAGQSRQRGDLRLVQRRPTTTPLRSAPARPTWSRRATKASRSR